ncbi:MAG: hypothetical protein H6658_11865 [Ardenticatenaceae bacterium]|nr:hypothetical protein [Ardenticatenaceae bacterium]
MIKNNQYQAYLIRFERHDNQTYWRTTLTNAQTNEVRHFATEQEALRYILTNLAEPSPDNRGALTGD